MLSRPSPVSSPASSTVTSTTVPSGPCQYLSFGSVSSKISSRTRSPTSNHLLRQQYRIELWVSTNRHETPRVVLPNKHNSLRFVENRAPWTSSAPSILSREIVAWIAFASSEGFHSVVILEVLFRDVHQSVQSSRRHRCRCAQLLVDRRTTLPTLGLSRQ